MDKQIETEAQVIEPPKVLSEADKWLAEKSSAIDKKAAGYTLFDITDRRTYRDMKQCRANANRDIKAFDEERKEMTRSIEKAVKEFKSHAKDVLLPLQSASDAYNEALKAYEAEGLRAREEELKGRWAEELPDLAENIKWETFHDRFAPEGKWDVYGTTSGKINESFRAAVEQVMSDLTTLRTVSRDEAELAAVLAGYYKTLDLAETVRSARERREAEESVAAQEQERREWEAQQVPTPAPTIELAVTDEGVIAARGPEQEAPAEAERVYTYVVTVPASKLQAFITAMKAIPGVHGTSQK